MEHAQRLDDLAGELQTLDLSEISHKVENIILFYLLFFIIVFEIQAY